MSNKTIKNIIFTLVFPLIMFGYHFIHIMSFIYYINNCNIIDTEMIFIIYMVLTSPLIISIIYVLIKYDIQKFNYLAKGALYGTVIATVFPIIYLKSISYGWLNEAIIGLILIYSSIMFVGQVLYYFLLKNLYKKNFENSKKINKYLIFFVIAVYVFGIAHIIIYKMGNAV